MAKKKANTFDDDFEIIVNDPLADNQNTEPENKKVVETNTETKPIAKESTSTATKTVKSAKKKANHDFDSLRKTVLEMREGGIFAEKNSTVQIPVKFLALIKDIAAATSRTSTEVTTAMIKIMANEMKDDILKMIEEKEKKTKNILD
ncbi:MAG: hypothetical protein CMO01_29675 [Thalassobius sp.]|nr:hypothetical protein [Thalassovita sp.]|tara:strand:- start:127 stop:567 length:441 start_codon:yes stop_codon:yes gene_type:complete